ncbi:MAG: HD domain-containing protein [Desulfobulbaceae bacterium]|nr:HD domain-containing protein [Desulfobulbaceae bacterium]
MAGKWRNHIIVQFTVITFVVVVAVSAGLGVLLARRMTDQTLRIHINLYPKFVGLLVKDHPSIVDFLRQQPPSALTPELENFFGDLKALGPIFRIKVWSPGGTILWSDQPGIIGQRFSDNPEFLAAMQGRAEYDIAEPTKPEQRSERGAGVVLEIYTPVWDHGAVVGVIELYEAADQLFWRIQRHNWIIWFMVGGAGLVLYLLLFSIYHRAHRAQQQANRRLLASQDVTIYALAYQAELRDMETGLHLDRTAAYVRILAEELQHFASYRAVLTDEAIEDLVKAAPLHDIGKVGVADAVLHKPGKLSPEEFGEMQMHSEYGASVLQAAADKLSFRSFLTIAIQVALGHHERWDGQGYPRGLVGEEIPLPARIMALADMYDALRIHRHYKLPLSHEESRRVIISGGGSQFDPQVVEAFLRRERDFEQVAEEMAD